MQHDHPPDYKHWDLVNHFTVEQVVCLWCEIKPSGSHLFTRLQHPEIIAIEQFIENAIRAGKLTADTKHAFVSIGDYSKAIVRRSQLKALAEEKGERPPFLFPEDRHELPPKTANPAKGVYVYNKTTKRIEFWSPVDAESVLSQHGKGLLGKLGAAEPSKAPPKVSKAAELSEPTIAATRGGPVGRRPASQSQAKKAWKAFDKRSGTFTFNRGELTRVANEIGQAIGYKQNTVEKIIRDTYRELEEEKKQGPA